MAIINSKETVHTVPETLDVSNVVQEIEGRMNEERICHEYSNETSFGHRHLVTLNTETQLNQSASLSNASNVPAWKESTRWRGRGKARRTVKDESRLSRVNAEWNLIYEQPPKTPINPTRNSRNISFNHESAATILFSETTEVKQTTAKQPRQQWKDFMLRVIDPRRNGGLDEALAQKLVDIAHYCRDAGLEFTFSAIEGHALFFWFAGGLSRYVLANLFNDAGGKVSLYCPLEQPGGGYEPNTTTVGRTSLRRELKYTTNGIRMNDTALEFERRWALFYDCMLDSGKVTDDQINEMTDFEANYTHHRCLVDCKKKYIKHFCKLAKWPRELIHKMLDMYQRALMETEAVADESNETQEETITHSLTESVTFESLCAESKSLGCTGGTLKFSAAARLLLQQQNTLSHCDVLPEPAVVFKPKPADINDTRPLGHEFHLDDQNRRVRRSLRIIYNKERMEARGN